MQKPLIIRDDNDNSLMELDKYLYEGWRVVATCAMPSSVGATSGAHSSATFKWHSPTCLVIIEKKENNEPS